MIREIQCIKLNKKAPGLPKPPFPGALGQRIYNDISQEAWRMWIAHQTMLINEYRLNLMEPNARTFLHQEMEKYFFGEGSEKPSGFSPE